MSGLAPAPDVTIERFEVLDTLADDVRAGLTREPRELPPKYFYDARGSELFDEITMLPEYYPTRRERAILNRHAPEIVAGAEELVELGSGTASKTRALLYAMAGAGTLRRYVPFDVDESVVEASAAELVELYPGLAVHGVVGDFGRDLAHVPPGERRLFAFLGGTIGNLHPPQRAAFLARLRGVMGTGDRLVLGTDLVKDPAVLVAAYDDAQGVSAEFNRNVLRVRTPSSTRTSISTPGSTSRASTPRRRASRWSCARCATRRCRSPARRWSSSSPRVTRFAPRSAPSSRPSGSSVSWAAWGWRSTSSSPTTRACSASRWRRPAGALDRADLPGAPRRAAHGARMRRMDLSGAGAIVAGGASGLGAATARELAARGARVAVADLNGEGASALASELGGNAIGLAVDVTDESQVEGAVARTREAFGGLRVAVSCAGIGWAERTVGKHGAAALGPFEQVIGVNLVGTYNVLRLSAAAMTENEPDAEGERGVVVMTASAAAFDGQVGQTAYSASKGGVVGLTLPAARDMARWGVRVCTIAPGLFDTPLLAALPEQTRDALGKSVPFPQRLGRPEEYAALACQIAENPMLNGETIRLDGALRMPPK